MDNILIRPIYDRGCAVCGKYGILTSFKKWKKCEPDSSLYFHGGGRSICDKCIKKRTDEIKRHNGIYHTPIGYKKDTNCEHQWVHPFFGRWVCSKCFAYYNWMCGCGGSLYVCDRHNADNIKYMIEKHGSIVDFLNKECR